MKNLYTENVDRVVFLDSLDWSPLTDWRENFFLRNEGNEGNEGFTNREEAVSFYRDVLTTIGQLAAEELTVLAAENDTAKPELRHGRVELPDSMKRCLELLQRSGIRNLTLSRSQGGMNLPFLVNLMVTEIISESDASLMTFFSLQEIACLIDRFGTSEQKISYLTPLTSSTATAAMTLTEADAGSDLNSIRTTATFDQSLGRWRVNGRKRFITNPDADIHLILARAATAEGIDSGLGLFLYKKSETLKIQRLESKLGLHSSPTGEIQYEEALCEPLGGDWKLAEAVYLPALLNSARLAVAAQALGIAQAAVRKARDYAQLRTQFGKPIVEFAQVWEIVFRNEMLLSCIRSLVYRSGFEWDLLQAKEIQFEKSSMTAKESQLKEISLLRRLNATLIPLSKFAAAEIGQTICSESLQLLGGAGYTTEFDLERHYRDIRITSIYEGTSQIQAQAALPGLLHGALEKNWQRIADDERSAAFFPNETRVLGEALLEWQKTVGFLRKQKRHYLDFHVRNLVEAALQLEFAFSLLGEALSNDRKAVFLKKFMNEQIPVCLVFLKRIASGLCTTFEEFQGLSARANPC